MMRRLQGRSAGARQARKRRRHNFREAVRGGEAGKLEWLLMAAREIAKRIQLELTQAAQAGSL